MIGKFFDMLFDYADELKAQGKKVEYETVHHVEDLLQRAYDAGMSNSIVIKNHKPQTKVEELVCSIPDIMVYKDKNDGYIWYELECDNGAREHRRFDFPEEVIKFVIDYRTNKQLNEIGKERDLMLMYISKRLQELRVRREVLEKDGNKKVNTVVGRKK